MKAAPEARRAGTQSQRRGGLGSRGGMRRKETTEDEGRAVFSSARVAFFKKGLHLKKKCDILKSAERNARRHIAPYAPLAQMDRAQASDAWCRRFESAMVRQTTKSCFMQGFFVWFSFDVDENRPQKIRRIFVQTRRKQKTKNSSKHIPAPKFGSDPPWCALDSQALCLPRTQASGKQKI